MEEGTQILTIVRQQEIATWDKEKGGKRTLYSVEALNEMGQPITETLRTFAELPIGKAMEFDVQHYNHPRHGESWTIHKPRENTASRVEKLEQRVNDLVDRVSALEGK